jgi:hypothetical protein
MEGILFEWDTSDRHGWLGSRGKFSAARYEVRNAPRYRLLLFNHLWPCSLNALLCATTQVPAMNSQAGHADNPKNVTCPAPSTLCRNSRTCDEAVSVNGLHETRVSCLRKRHFDLCCTPHGSICHPKERMWTLSAPSSEECGLISHLRRQSMPQPQSRSPVSRSTAPNQASSGASSSGNASPKHSQSSSQY